jgi:predicted TIM-barrel fold metal-dependent hydrolase
MIVDCDRHVAVRDYAELNPYMTESWRRHFERDEFMGSVREAAAHVRMTDRFGDEVDVGSPPGPDVDLSLSVSHQGLTINGWSDQVAAKTFVEALNSYAEEHWSDDQARKAAVIVNANDPVWSAEVIRRRARSGRFGAVALPLIPTLMGVDSFDPIYAAAVEVGLPVVAHFSGVEGHYLGAPSLGGGVHGTAFARAALMPQLAETNITSLCLGGTFETFPDLRMLFSGFGFGWLPSLLWRLDREWRTFRHDVPWVKRPPSEYVLESIWLTTWPAAESSAEWGSLFSEDALRGRVVFGSHDPFDGDSVETLRTVLGQGAEEVLANGAAVLGPVVGAGV